MASGSESERPAHDQADHNEQRRATSWSSPDAVRADRCSTRSRRMTDNHGRVLPRQHGVCHPDADSSTEEAPVIAEWNRRQGASPSLLRSVMPEVLRDSGAEGKPVRRRRAKNPVQPLASHAKAPPRRAWYGCCTGKPRLSFAEGASDVSATCDQRSSVFGCTDADRRIRQARTLCRGGPFGRARATDRHHQEVDPWVIWPWQARALSRGR